MKAIRLTLIWIGLGLIALTLRGAEQKRKALPPAVLDKAEAILTHAEVFATARVGQGQGKQSEEAWAFTVLLKYADDPQERFLHALNEATPAGRLYGLLGLRATGYRFYQALGERISRGRGEKDEKIEILRGETIAEEPLKKALAQITTLRVDDYVLDPLPDFFHTQRYVKGQALHEKVSTEKDVIVGRLAKAIPVPDQEAWDFIWNEFSTRPETHSFQHYTGKDWQKNYAIFAAALVARAKQEGYEAEALRKCLDKLIDEPIAKDPMGKPNIGYLPIEAYRTTRGKQEVWVIFCLWEYATDPSQTENIGPPMTDTDEKSATGKAAPPPEKPGWLELAHIRMFTYDLKSAELIGFVTCG